MKGSLALMALPGPLRSMLAQAPAEYKGELWYGKPAERWLEALPIGNGHLGGMVYGGSALERIALSESTAWSGAPTSEDVNPGALAHLKQIRELFFAGNYDEAQALCGKFLPGHGRNFGTNLPLPELHLAFENSGAVAEYRRSLNLEEAVARVQYERDGVHYTREIFASNPDGAIVMRLTASEKGKVSFRLSFSKSSLPYTVEAGADNTLHLDGHCYETKHSSGNDGVAFRISARVIAEGGRIESAPQSLEVQGADSVIILLAVSTSYRNADPQSRNMELLKAAAHKGYAQLLKTHLADYQPLMRRMSIELGETSPALRLLPTDARRQALEKGADDPELIALFFQYGRYLTIAGSRANSPLPLALQGIWNDGLASSMGWTDDYHLDINTQQNYWAAEVCNLAECQTPLFDFMDMLRKTGRETARQMYGADGWVVHTTTNAWGYTAPGSPGWGIAVTAGIWLSLQLWDHYAYSGDRELLRARVYPVLREAAEFFLDYMVEEPRHGWLVTGPSDSPENWYIAPNGSHIAESMGNTFDRVLVNALFSMCIEAEETLSMDAAFRGKLVDARAKLPPFQIGRHGQLQEWMEDFEDGEPNHRHTSHLIALYPEHQIGPRSTPKLAQAAEVTIQRRMNAPHWEQSEWGRANLVAYYARLLKGDEAHKYLVSLLAKATDDNLLTYSSAGVAGAESNIFSLDGNTAGAAGIAEMLLQSQSGEIELLPALPGAWKNGYVRGLRARGGYVVDVEWKDGILKTASIVGDHAGTVQVRYRDSQIPVRIRSAQPVQLRSESFRNTSAAMSGEPAHGSAL